MQLGQILILVGLTVAAAGGLLVLGVPLGRLPGDIVVQRGNFSFYLPLTTCIVASILLTLLIAFFRR